MPQGEAFWNPYRWVPVSREPVPRDEPAYRHRFSGLSGRISCTLHALTPFLIGSSQGDGHFIRSKLTSQPFIPGTSLKGLIRSLAELIGNASIPFPRAYADEGHALAKAATGSGPDWRLDPAARMFGFLDGKRVFAGLVKFSDGMPVGRVKEMAAVQVVVGRPKPEDHKPFYPNESARKFYHHRFGATALTRAPSHIKQTRTVYPLEPGSEFTFSVTFENLREPELSLLLYCLVLEESVTVELSKDALGPKHHQAVVFTGPLRHKLGGCKPQGGGSIKIGINRLELRPSPADRYRGQLAAPQVFEKEALSGELNRRAQLIADRKDPTMVSLRAMLIYCEDDPRTDVDYPDYAWFADDKGTGKNLKPTL
jgi:CRISPR/Cas system CSM-associated protein Csm3 (group 7 of RAMP superfamily)